MAKEAAKKKDEAEEEKDVKPGKKGKIEDDEVDADAEEGEGEEGAEGEGAPKKKSKKKLIIILVLLLVLLIAGAAAAWFFVYNKHEDKAAEGGAASGEHAGGAVYYNLPEFLVNLNTGGKQSSYLKMTVVLELAKQTDVITVESNLPRLFDTLNTYLRELRASDLAGSAGIQRLREELLMRANQTLAPTKVSDVLFKEIVVQ